MVAILACLAFKTQQLNLQLEQEQGLNTLVKLDQLNINADISALKISNGNQEGYTELDASIKSLNAILSQKKFNQLVTHDGFTLLSDRIKEKVSLADGLVLANDGFKSSLSNIFDKSAEINKLIANFKVTTSPSITSVDMESRNLLDQTLTYSLYPSEAAANRLRRTVEDAHSTIASLRDDAEQEARRIRRLDARVNVADYVQNLNVILDNADALAAQALEIVKAKNTVETSLNKFLSSSISLVTNNLAKAIDAKQMEKKLELQTYYLALIGYAGVLILVIFFLAVRASMSAKHVHEIKESLEKRVEERTLELTGMMDELRNSEAMVVQSEKMASLGQMVAGVAHEINTPLAYVRSTLETLQTNLIDSPLLDFIRNAEALLTLMLSEDASEEDTARQFSVTAEVFQQLNGEGSEIITEMSTLIKDGVYGVDQIYDLILNLRNFTRLDQDKIAFTDLNDAVDSALMLAKHDIKTRHVIKQLQGIPNVQCVASQINQVLLNIIINAVHATSEGPGVIIIATSQVDENHVTIAVADNGKGIGPEAINKVFDPFFTTKEVGQGTGLGLSISYRIIKAHGGDIKVESAVGVGTKFTITLPILIKNEESLMMDNDLIG